LVHFWHFTHFWQCEHLWHGTAEVAEVAQGRVAAAVWLAEAGEACSMNTTSRMRAPRPAMIQARSTVAVVLRGVVAGAAMMSAFFLERSVLMSSLSVI
jgi:hypothetical protein